MTEKVTITTILAEIRKLSRDVGHLTVINRRGRVSREAMAALVKLTSIRDNYTHEHQIRVNQLAVEVAQHLGMTSDEVSCICFAASMHDIGKTAVPLQILRSPEKLTPQEMALVQTHSEIGAASVGVITFPWPVSVVVRQHHERINGSGYPDGLKDKQILPQSKVIGVTDVWDALSANRPYRRAMRQSKVIEHFEEASGRLYDHDVVRAIVEVSVKKGKKRRSLR